MCILEVEQAGWCHMNINTIFTFDLEFSVKGSLGGTTVLGTGRVKSTGVEVRRAAIGH